MSCGSDFMSGNSEADDLNILEKDPTGRYIRVFLFYFFFDFGCFDSYLPLLVLQLITLAIDLHFIQVFNYSILKSDLSDLNFGIHC